MAVGVREFLKTSVGKNVAIAAAIIGLGVCVWSIASNFGDDEATALSKGRVFICAETKETYNVELSAGMKIPYDSPYSGKPTGFPAEMCYWTKDGKIKQDPTPVLINGYVNQPEPTFCPDCGRIVTVRNPFPEPGSRPPPTQAEWKSRNAGG
jgi:hypothetical protein